MKSIARTPTLDDTPAIPTDASPGLAGFGYDGSHMACRATPTNHPAAICGARYEGANPLLKFLTSGSTRLLLHRRGIS
jgi:hypothetical protein